MTREFKSEWRNAAEQYVLRNWMRTKWRYQTVEHAPIEDVAQAAMSTFRGRLDCAYRHLVEHPRSRKAPEHIRQHAQELASIGLWLLENQ